MNLPVFHHGNIVGTTRLHPVVAQIARARSIVFFIQYRATEMRWDAYGAFGWAYADDPNEAILDCAFKRIERRRK